MRCWSKAAAHLPSDGKSAHVTHLRLAPVAPPQRVADDAGVRAMGGEISTERRSSLSRVTHARAARELFAAGDARALHPSAFYPGVGETIKTGNLRSLHSIQRPYFFIHDI